MSTVKEEFLRSMRKHIGQWFMDHGGRFYPPRPDEPPCEAEWVAFSGSLTNGFRKSRRTSNGLSLIGFRIN